MTWENRIVGSGEIDPIDIKLHPKNWRKHPKGQASALEGALEEIGWIQDVIINQRSGKLLDGHLRVELALKKKESKVPVKFVDLSEEEEELALLTLDPITAMAEADKEALKALMDAVTTDNEDIQKMIDDLAAENKIQPKEAIEDDYEPPAEIETDIQRGDIFLLGRHRVMCGDSTSQEDVERLMDGPTPEIMVTDPPYGVDYDPHWRDNVVGEFGQRAARGNGALNDNRLDWSDAFKLFSGDVTYIWHAGKFAAEVAHQITNSGFDIRNQIIWKKQHFALSRGDYHWMHEPCWYAVRSGKKSGWCGDRTQSTVWEISSLNPAGRKEERVAHGNQKPIECMARPIRNHNLEVVYDPFLGSGTTLIACEQLDRICYGMEISPQYCEVICQRWEKLTGRTRQKVNGVNT
jgi:DNA modification methylase